MCQALLFTQALNISLSVLHAQPLQALRIGCTVCTLPTFKFESGVPIASKPSVRG